MKLVILTKFLLILTAPFLIHHVKHNFTVVYHTHIDTYTDIQTDGQREIYI